MSMIFRQPLNHTHVVTGRPISRHGGTCVQDPRTSLRDTGFGVKLIFMPAGGFMLRVLRALCGFSYSHLPAVADPLSMPLAGVGRRGRDFEDP